MRTLEQVDALFDVEIPAAERRGEERGLRLGEERGLRLGEERGLRLGEELGEERGLRLGAQQGKLQTISLQVQAKFGDQPEVAAILTQMAGLDEIQLNAIATEIFRWQTLADVVAWLERLES